MLLPTKPAPPSPVFSHSASPLFSLPLCPQAQGANGAARPAQATQYTFTRAFGEGADNERVFREAAEGGVEEALSRGTGYLLFSYGAWGGGPRPLSP